MDEHNHPGHSGEEHYYAQSPYAQGDKIGSPPFRRPGQRLLPIFIVAATILLVVVIVFGVVIVHLLTTSPQTVVRATPTTATTPLQTGATPTTAAPTPTPTLVPTPTPLIYTADWSHGPNGWAVNDVWRVYGGALHSSGTGEIPFPIQLEPSSSGTTDYTVEWKGTANNSGGFGVNMRAGNDGSTYGYHITFNNQDINQNVWIYIFIGPGHIYGDYKKLFTVGQESHDYVVSVIANHIIIKIDGSTVMQVQDNTFITGGSSSFISNGQVDITYLKVTQQ